MRCVYALTLLLVAFANVGHAQTPPARGPFEQVTGTTVLDVSDARSRIQAYDLSQVNVLAGGSISWLYTYNQSSVAVNAGASVSWLYAYEGSTVTVSDGAVSWLTVLDQGIALVNGGDITYLGIYGNAIGEVRGGQIGYLTLSEAATVDVYGYDFEFNGLRLTGRWADGTSFSFAVQQAEAPHQPPSGVPIALPANLNLHLVPAPVNF